MQQPAIHARTVEPAVAAQWLRLADQALARARHDPDAVAGFVATSSSLALHRVSDLPIAQIWHALRDRPAVKAAAAALGRDELALCASQSWLRRQYPPQLAPDLHAPHQWHQDGALGWRFDPARPAAAPPADALLPLQTLWIALTDCGRDAPALQWVPALESGAGALWPLADLNDEAVRRRSAAVPVSADLAAGDALRFDGALLHRTQPALGMTWVRTSIELRLFRADALPPRLAGEVWVPVDTAAP